jgi:hypothetical protein
VNGLAAKLARLVFPAALALLGFKLLLGGKLVLAAAAGAAALLAWWQPRRKAAPPLLGEAEARAVLGLSAGAGADEIRAAHRRLIARVHPDAGGSDALAARVTAARDLLLERLART